MFRADGTIGGGVARAARDILGTITQVLFPEPQEAQRHDNDPPVPSINSSALKNVSDSDTPRLDEFFDHTGMEYLLQR